MVVDLFTSPKTNNGPDRVKYPQGFLCIQEMEFV